MSLQEKSHASLLKYGRKLVYRSPKSSMTSISMKAIASLLGSLGEFRAGPRAVVGRGLFFAMKIEGHPAENGHRDVLAISNPEISQMIKSLAVADEEHHQTLRLCAPTRG